MDSGPKLIFWELTKNCNLRCPYCRLETDSSKKSKILTRQNCFSIIDSIAKYFRPLIVFTGGEPLVYPHLFEVAGYARDSGLQIALATNATFIDIRLAEKISKSSFHRVAVSLDGSNSKTHDALRGEGTFLKTMNGINNLISQDVSIQINTTLFRKNFKEVPSIYRLCQDSGIRALHIFAFVPVGCGINIPKDEVLTGDEYEEFLNQMAELYLDSKDIEIRLTCAPHFQRVLAKKEYLSDFRKGCLAAISVCFISSQAEVFPCGYLPISGGNVLFDDFKKIWTESNFFQELRQPENLKGRCGACEFKIVCGGCRARAWAVSSDYLEEEPECLYQPSSVKF